MNRINIYLCLLIILITCGITVFYSLKAYFKEKQKNKELLSVIENHKSNFKMLIKHIQESSKINKDKTDRDKKISEAKNDEEVFNIINSIVDANNNRLHNNQN